MEPHRTGRNEPKSRVLEPGRTLGPYLVLRTLSTSPRSIVHMAHDLALDRPVALKSAPRGVASVVNEARILARLNHPHIVTLYALWPQPQALVLEYLAGETLKARRERGDILSADTVRGWMIDIVAALETVHAQGIAHGALHADNLFLTEPGGIKLIDFRQSGAADAPATANDDLRAIGRLISELSVEQADPALADIARHASAGRFSDARALRLALTRPARRIALTMPSPIPADLAKTLMEPDDCPVPSINPMVPVFDSRPWVRPDRGRLALLALILAGTAFIVAMGWGFAPGRGRVSHAARVSLGADRKPPPPRPAKPADRIVAAPKPPTPSPTGAYAALAHAWGG